MELYRVDPILNVAKKDQTIGNNGSVKSKYAKEYSKYNLLISGR